MAKSMEILRIFPDYMRDQWREAAEEADGLWEIRLRVHREIILMIRGREYFLSKNGKIVSDRKSADVMTQQDMEAVLDHVCN